MKRASKPDADKSVRMRKQDLVRSILLDMFRGELRTDSRLVEVTLAERFNVSRTPVREALMRLSAIGLVELRPNCGAVVRPFGLQQVREIYEIREILESSACRRACGRIAPARLEELKTAFETLAAETRHDADWGRREWAVDSALHELIVHHCGNGRLAEEVANYGELIQIVRETVGNARRMQEVAIGEHLAIIHALLRNKPDAASDAMRDHIRSACAAALEALKHNFEIRPTKKEARLTATAR